ncbi:MAG: putative tyrosine recombinase XerC-like protein [Methanosaeta sp. PtaB.Bin039]|nr:MAG: putative tyrosine recombinase XerC-like protein [Methanosaeta sp. PtaB.Bin039]
MSKNRLKLDWSIKAQAEDFKPAITRFRRYLKDKGLRESTINSYVDRVIRFLEYAQSDMPSAKKAQDFRDSLLARNLARSTVNNYAFAIESYYKMNGQEISFPFLERNNMIPYYFTNDEVLRVFSACTNLKHMAMLMTAFYGCLRASEVCNLDDEDLDLKSLTLRVREGKGGKDGIVYITEDCARILRHYLQARPPLEIDGLHPLFYTDFGRRWDRRDIHRMFVTYKKAAGIEKKGGVHVFARHTPATIMVANGCDIRVIKELLRHEDIRTTLRYAHVSDKTKRENYEHCLTL